MIPQHVLDRVVDLALAEDLEGGDLTTEATVAADARGIGRVVARSALVFAGGAVLARVFYRVDPGVRVEQRIADGELAEPGAVLMVVEGATRSLLIAERTALNFVQRMSGIATLARRFVDALPAGSTTRVTDTRKTTPGLRALERYAVRAGGAHNHRNDLGAAVLIKDNHIEAAGGVRPALARARARAPHTSRLEIEVESLDMLDEALAAGADVVMLDNFAPEALDEAIARARGRAVVEVSGGVGLARIAELAGRGVDVISVGALTHSAPSADIALDLERLV
ncbi:MAG: carboxylating nicotinate-nucleotide diphosphorylase [Polyangiaceae bacterium]|nr:carboxylating nicotinate-nucleotide diphosphorylase [Polyangiaceae bacterium]